MIKGDLVPRLVADRVPFVVATVVRAAKPTSVRPGDSAVVLADGTIEGFVGGVCAQESVRLHAARVLETDVATLRSLVEESGRELAAEIERLVLYAEDDGYIRPENISSRICPQGTAQTQAERLDDLLDDYERRVITETLKRHDCNVAKASEALGLGSRQTLYKKLKRLAIDIGDFLQEDTEPGIQYRA